LAHSAPLMHRFDDDDRLFSPFVTHKIKSVSPTYLRVERASGSGRGAWR